MGREGGGREAGPLVTLFSPPHYAGTRASSAIGREGEREKRERGGGERGVRTFTRTHVHACLYMRVYARVHACTYFTLACMGAFERACVHHVYKFYVYIHNITHTLDPNVATICKYVSIYLTETHTHTHTHIIR